MHYRLVSVGMILLAAGCAAPNPVSSSSVPGARIETDYSRFSDVAYTPDTWPRALKADIYQPKSAGPWPAILVIYGGSWSSADHRWQMRLLAGRLARRGFVVMTAQYRGTPEDRYPAPVDDLREAVKWLRTHAAEYQARPHRIAAFGFSAGGHLAAMAGTLDGPPAVRVQAVVAASAPADLALYPGGKILPRFLGATFAERPDLFRAASPVTYVSPDDPPVFLYHGTADTTVSPDHSRVFKAALDRAGVRNELRWIEGRGHAGVLLRGGTAEAARWTFWMRRYAEQLLAQVITSRASHFSAKNRYKGARLYSPKSHATLTFRTLAIARIS